ncbi:MAG: hypothetical protein WCP20_15400 [Desulfuromonadales bacterium]
MSNALLLFIAGIFVGAAIFELSKRAKTKSEFTHMLEGFVEKEAEDFLYSNLSINEKRLVSDF